MQVMAVGKLRKAALVKRQALGQREVVVVNMWKLDSSPAFVTSWGGHCVLPWGANQLSALAGGSFSAGMR